MAEEPAEASAPRWWRGPRKPGGCSPGGRCHDGRGRTLRGGDARSRERTCRGLLEALVFASDKPLKTGELARLASARVKQVRELLDELKAESVRRGIVLDEIAGGWIFRTSAKYAPFVRDLASERPVRLTRAQIETLAIAAYRQPITHAPRIDEIRGVDSGATLKLLLLERDLLRILGKKDEPGRPLLYGTTSQFLEFFGLKSLKDSVAHAQGVHGAVGRVSPRRRGGARRGRPRDGGPRARDTISPPDTGSRHRLRLRPRKTGARHRWKTSEDAELGERPVLRVFASSCAHLSSPLAGSA